MILSPVDVGCYDSCYSAIGANNTYYDSEIQSCVSCSELCASCYGTSASECYECNPSYVFIGESTCIELICADGFWKDEENMVC